MLSAVSWMIGRVNEGGRDVGPWAEVTTMCVCKQSSTDGGSGRAGVATEA